MFTYMIFGVLRGSREGLQFQSCVPELERHPELWADECPFPIASVAQARIELATELNAEAASTPPDHSAAVPPSAPASHAARQNDAPAWSA